MIPLDPVIFWILVVWLTLFGACIGSFLNVVVYRLPLGKNLSDPPSHCPKCKHQIRWFDNIPVFGWFFLHGKCRDCREPINVRYPIVEAISGGVFGSIAFLLLRREGDASFQEFLCLTVALSTLVLTLLAAGLIELDGQKIPWKLFIPAALMGPMVPYLWQESFHIAMFGYLIGNPVPVQWPRIGMIFLLFALPIALLSCWMPEKKQRFGWLISSAIIVVYLGWASVPVLLFSSIALILIYFTPLRILVPSYLVLTLATFVFVLIVLAQTPTSATLG